MVESESAPGAGSLTCWVVSDGKAGMENQCLGLAAALGLTPAVKRIALREPWRSLTPWLRWGLRSAFDTKKGAAIAPPWPDLLIATGRQSIAASLYVKAQNPRTVTVQIQDPVLDAKFFDLVIAPRHDGLSGLNVLQTVGALHRVTPELLQSERARFAPLVDGLPNPRIAVLIGGSNGVYNLTPEITAEFCQSILKLREEEDAGFMVTPSRRTGAENMKVLRQWLGNKKGIVLWDGFNDPSAANPYYGFLASADLIIATGDSVSMVSEACSTGKPVMIFYLPGGSPKFEAFHRGLRLEGFTRQFRDKLEFWRQPPLDDMGDAVKRVRTLLKRQ